jgi:hypothetical protein
MLASQRHEMLDAGVTSNVLASWRACRSKRAGVRRFYKTVGFSTAILDYHATLALRAFNT